MISSFYGVSPRFKHVRDGDGLVFKDGIKLKFIHTPWLYWPETIMTYSSYNGILFSCDAFGGFSIPSSLYGDDEEFIEKYGRYVRKYLVRHYRCMYLGIIEIAIYSLKDELEATIIYSRLAKCMDINLFLRSLLK